MPELPEVEHVVRALAPRVTGRHILAAELNLKRIAPGISRTRFNHQLQNALITGVGRRGKYILFNEFTTAQGATQIERHVVSTDGADGADSPATLTPDLGTPQRSAGLEAVLTTPMTKIRRRVPTPFFLDVMRDGQPASDLEPYLGAVCHVVIVSADTKQFAHTHGDLPGGAMSGDMSKMDMATMAMPTPPAKFGPRLEFTHTFMQPGPYRLWVQTSYKGEVATFGYNVMVEK